MTSVTSILFGGILSSIGYWKGPMQRKPLRAIILANDSKDPTSDGSTTQIALTLETMHRNLGSEIYTVAEAVSRDSLGPLKAAGVEDVICLESIIPPILVQAFLDPGVAEVTAELASNRVGSQVLCNGDLTLGRKEVRRSTTAFSGDGRSQDHTHCDTRQPGVGHQS